MNSTDDYGNHLEVDPEYKPLRDVTLLILYSVTALFAIVANFFVCKIVVKNDQMQTRTNLLIVSMAISDILAGVGIPAQWLFCSANLLTHNFGRFVCGSLKCLQIVTYSVSSFTMVTIAFHRYLDIFHRSRIGLTRMKFNVKAAIISNWIIAIIFVALTAVSIKIFKYFTSKEIISCEVLLEFTEPFDSKKVRRIRVALLIFVQFLSPLIITVMLYARIMFVVFRRQVVGESSERRVRKLSQSKKKTIVMLIVVLIVFTICWLPVHTHHFVDFIVSWKNERRKRYCNNSTSYFILYWLGISSCCYNPIIYYIFDHRFRNEFHNLFRTGEKPITTELKITNSSNTRSENLKQVEASDSNTMDT